MTGPQIAFAEEMIGLIREEFRQIPEPRAAQRTIALEDALMMSAYAVFSLRFPSLLHFEVERKQRQATQSN